MSGTEKSTEVVAYGSITFTTSSSTDKNKEEAAPDKFQASTTPFPTNKNVPAPTAVDDPITIKDTGPYSQVWSNWSSVGLTLDHCSVYDDTSPYITIIMRPQSQLQYGQDAQVLPFKQTWTSVNVAPCFCQLVWKDPTNDNRYGVQIYQGQQVGGAGFAPWYAVKTNDTRNPGYKDWVNPVKDPSEPYAFQLIRGTKSR